MGSPICEAFGGICVRFENRKGFLRNDSLMKRELIEVIWGRLREEK